jgi:hypothetical protein
MFGQISAVFLNTYILPKEVSYFAVTISVCVCVHIFGSYNNFSKQLTDYTETWHCGTWKQLHRIHIFNCLSSVFVVLVYIFLRTQETMDSP